MFSLYLATVILETTNHLKNTPFLKLKAMLMPNVFTEK